jgi:hypothetical protein
MYCIENEFNQCIAAIKNQTHKDFEYFVVQNLPNKEAHEQLYQTFMSNTNFYDYFIKVDADMVIARNTFFEEVIEYLYEKPDVDDLEILIHDFFTDTLIFGLHVYSNRYVWKKNDEKIFVDIPQNNQFKYIKDTNRLVPAAYHCPNPSDFQSFHFGVHKAIKVMQRGREGVDNKFLAGHWSNVSIIRERFLNSRNLKVGFAALGAEIALRRWFDFRQTDYNNQKLISAFTRVKDFQVKDMVSYTNSFSLKSMSFLSGNLRREAITHIHGNKSLSLNSLRDLLYLVRN